MLYPALAFLMAAVILCCNVDMVKHLWSLAVDLFKDEDEEKTPARVHVFPSHRRQGSTASRDSGNNTAA